MMDNTGDQKNPATAGASGSPVGSSSAVPASSTASTTGSSFGLGNTATVVDDAFSTVSSVTPTPPSTVSEPAPANPSQTVQVPSFSGQSASSGMASGTVMTASEFTSAPSAATPASAYPSTFDQSPQNLTPQVPVGVSSGTVQDVSMGSGLGSTNMSTDTSFQTSPAPQMATQSESVTPISGQLTNPIDPPPPPASSEVPQVGGNLNEVITSGKPKKKFPVLLFLIILILLVFGAVGYLAYTNFVMKKEVSPTASNSNKTTLPTPTPGMYENFISFRSTLLPLTFMVPSNWNVEENQNVELANQKMILAQSPDFAYEGSEIASGYEFRIGPVNDLSKKYDSFEAFVAEENTSGDYNTVTYNNINWLKKGSSAKTIIETTPVTVTMYSNTAQAADSLLLFNKILESIQLSPGTVTGPVTTPGATSTPSATPQ